MNLWLVAPSFAEQHIRNMESIKGMDLSLFAQSLFSEKPKEEKYKIDSEGSAIIPITGALSNQVDIFAKLFGYAPSMTYDEMIEAIDQAENDPKVKSIKYLFNTPGGQVLGLDEVAVAMQLAKKPNMAIVKGMCCSAGYYLASQSDEIVAVSEASQVGSIGVAVRMYSDPNSFTMSNSAAPKKVPDPRTEKGRDIITEELDATAELFYKRIQEGRNVSIDTIKSNYGQGGTFMAESALKAGMIDRIETRKVSMSIQPAITTIGASTPNQVNASLQIQNKQTEYSPNLSGLKTKEKKRMDIQTLKTEHPEVFAQALAQGKDEGFKAGLEAERTRIAAINAYKVSDPENKELIKLCDSAIAEGKDISMVAPMLQVAIRDFKKPEGSGNASATKTDTVDPIEGANAVAGTQGAGQENAEKYDPKARVKALKEAGSLHAAV